MSKCKDCKKWYQSDYITDEYNGWTIDYKNNYEDGRWVSVEILKRIENSKNWGECMNKDMMVASCRSEGINGELITNRNFGCNCWESDE